MTPRTAACQAILSSTVSWGLLKFMSIELVMLSNHLILCRPLHLLLSTFPSIRVFSSESSLWIRWSENQNFSLSNSPSNEYSGLISLRTHWFDLFTVQGTLRVFSSITIQKHHKNNNIIIIIIYVELPRKNNYNANSERHHCNLCHLKLCTKDFSLFWKTMSPIARPLKKCESQ